jgi:hypothetical protein
VGLSKVRLRFSLSFFVPVPALCRVAIRTVCVTQSSQHFSCDRSAKQVAGSEVRRGTLLGRRKAMLAAQARELAPHSSRQHYNARHAHANGKPSQAARTCTEWHVRTVGTRHPPTLAAVASMRCASIATVHLQHRAGAVRGDGSPPPADVLACHEALPCLTLSLDPRLDLVILPDGRHVCQTGAHPVNFHVLS